MNVYFELTPVTVKCQLIQALSVMTIQMYLILFIKIWAIPSWKAKTDKKYTSLEIKDGWESLNGFVKCPCQIALDTLLLLNCIVAPQPFSVFSTCPKLSLWNSPQKKRHGFLCLPKSICEIAVTILSRMWILHFCDNTLNQKMIQMRPERSSLLQGNSGHRRWDNLPGSQ